MSENAVELVRSNKVTAYWEGEGVAVGVFYKTHTKLVEKRSNDADVIAAGFVMPEDTDEAPITAQEKLAAFKNFLQINASVFGIQYDPVDRRADEFKFPNKYDEETFKDYSKKMAEKSISETLEKVQKNVVANMIKSEHLAEGTEVNFGIGEAEVEIKEAYANGNIKYADAKYPVVLQVGDATVETFCVVSAVSGQLKKPRELADGVVLTQTGIKTFMIENGLLPKIEKPAKEEVAEDCDETATVSE
jgi:hypothetical protein